LAFTGDILGHAVQGELHCARVLGARLFVVWRRLDADRRAAALFGLFDEHGRQLQSRSERLWSGSDEP
jgi:hypothetical protein